MVTLNKIIAATALAIELVTAAPTTPNVPQFADEQRVGRHPAVPGTNEQDVGRLVSLLDDVLEHTDEKSVPQEQAQDNVLPEAVELVGMMLEDLRKEDAFDNEYFKRDDKYYDFKDWPEDWKKNSAGQFNNQYEKDMKDNKVDHPAMYYADWVKVLSDESLQIDLFEVVYPTSAFQQTASFLKVLAKVECMLLEKKAILKAPRGCPV